MAVTAIRNETPSRLTLVSIDDERMVFAPLQTRVIPEDSGFHFDELAQEGIVSKRTDAPSGVSERIIVTVVGGGFWLLVIGAVLANIDPWFEIDAADWPYWVWGTEFLILFVAVATFVIRGTNSFSLIVRWTLQTVALAVILTIGLGVPAATIYFFGNGQDLVTAADQNIGAGSLALFGRLIQLAFIAIASLLPVLMFFLFDRYRLGTLRNSLYINLFRLDHSVSTTGEIDAKYGSQISEAYGSDEQGRGRLSPGSRWPVLVCAFVITIGWVITLAPVEGLAHRADRADHRGPGHTLPAFRGRLRCQCAHRAA